jgi:hypothetical protein
MAALIKTRRRAIALRAIASAAVVAIAVLLLTCITFSRNVRWVPPFDASKMNWLSQKTFTELGIDGPSDGYWETETVSLSDLPWALAAGVTLATVALILVWRRQLIACLRTPQTSPTRLLHGLMGRANRVVARTNTAQRLVIAMAAPCLALAILAIMPGEFDAYEWARGNRAIAYPGWWIFSLVIVGAFELWLWRSRPSAPEGRSRDQS